MTTLFYQVHLYFRYLILVGLWPIVASAGISLDATRLIMAADDQGKGVRIGVMSGMDSLTPYLVKTKITQDVEGTQTEVPFLVTPPIFRLDPGRSQQLLVIPKRIELASDRESVFYLSVSALPSTSEVEHISNNQTRGQLIVATGTIIKLFYRPAGLPISQREAMSQLQFTHTNSTLMVKNPTPFYITLTSLSIGGVSLPVGQLQGRSMLAPFTQEIFTNVSPRQGVITWTAINDYGGLEVFSSDDI